MVLFPFQTIEMCERRKRTVHSKEIKMDCEKCVIFGERDDQEICCYVRIILLMWCGKFFSAKNGCFVWIWSEQFCLNFHTTKLFFNTINVNAMVFPRVTIHPTSPLPLALRTPEIMKGNVLQTTTNNWFIVYFFFWSSIFLCGNMFVCILVSLDGVRHSVDVCAGMMKLVRN